MRNVVPGKRVRVVRGGAAARDALLVVPCLAYVACAFIGPLAYMAVQSVQGSPAGGAYARLVREPVYAQVFLNTAFLAAVVTIAALALGYPLALTAAMATPRVRRVLVLVVAVPFWTSLLVRSYAWLVLLQQRGIVNQVLLDLHVIDEPLQLVYNATGVVLGMTYVLLPFMVFSLFASIRAIDPKLYRTAATLGASRTEIFWRVLVPLSRSGVVAGSSIVFVLAIGFFVTPALLGGLRQTTIGMLIDAQINKILDWPFGSALALTLTVIVVSIAMLATRSSAAVRRLIPEPEHAP
jgi:putative spermidine/putrescine transport system permease protein